MSNYEILCQLCETMKREGSVIDVIEAARKCLLISNDEASKLADVMGVQIS